MKKLLVFCLSFILLGIINVYAGTTYQVLYSLAGGTNNKGNITQYEKLDADFTLLSPTMKGYTFEGWYSDKALTNKVTVIPKGSTGIKIFYAKWSANHYSIKYDGNGAKSGSMAIQTGIKYSADHRLAANEYAKPGYTFTGWNTKADGSGTSYANKAKVTKLTATDNKTIKLYAQWKIVDYTITYKLNSGTNNKSNPTSYTIKSSTITLLEPTKKGYTFDGWYSDSAYTEKVTTIKSGSTGNITLYAKWIVNTYSVKYDGNGAKSGSMTTKTGIKYNSNYKLAANAYKKPDYVFDSWNTKADGSGTSYANKATVSMLTATNNKTIKLYAQWKPEEYIITYYLDGGENNKDNPETYNMNSEILFKKPTKRGYTFVGWFSDSSFKNSVLGITQGNKGNKEFYAKWTKKKYTITYDLTGGNNNENNPNHYNVESEYELFSPTRNGFIFDRWEDEVGNTVTMIPKGSIGSKTLIARWKINPPKMIVKNVTRGKVAISIYNNSVNNYEILRKASGESEFIIMASTSQDIYYDTSVVPGQKYYYKVRLYNYRYVNQNWIYEESDYTNSIAIVALDENASKNDQAVAMASILMKKYSQSRRQMISHLESMDFTNSQAIYGADHCGVNWKTNAVKKAEEILNQYSVYYSTRTNIQTNLQSAGFTDEQIEYALAHVNTDWNDRAILVTQYYLESYKTDSKAAMISRLIANGFTEEEAEYGVNNASVNWNEQALNRAKNLIASGNGYSRLSLISEIEYYEFTHDEAVYGADNISADWNEEAKKRAKRLLKLNGYSLTGIITNLESYYRFTYEQAVYGANNCDADWNEQAVKSAVFKISYGSGTSKVDLISYLRSTEGFTEEEAIYGANNCDVNFNDEAAKRARYLVRHYNYDTKEDLIDTLETINHFTHDEAVYGADHSEYNWN